MVIVLFQDVTGAPNHSLAATLQLPVASVDSSKSSNAAFAEFSAPLAVELERLCAALVAAPELRVVSVFAQSFEGLSQPPPNHPHTLLWGRSTITEDLCGMRFHVSPGAFFQVNSGAAARLYNLVRDLAINGAAGFQGSGIGVTKAVSSHSLAVLDVCCGTGTIGIVCSPLAARVVGVELSENAIADAIVNARLNNVANATFVCSRAEEVMPRLLSLALLAPQENASANSTAAASSALAVAGEAAGSSVELTSTSESSCIESASVVQD